MTTNTQSGQALGARQMLNKVPEVTIWFWIIKILCTTVGESFADWINMTLGVGLNNTAVLFTVVLVVVLGVQLYLPRYVPFAYWLTVVVVSVTGTLYTDILTDSRGVALKVSSAVFAVLLAVVFAVWYARERTLSIHSITTLPREAFYWLAVLVTFALGTATGDWTLELTGWAPAKSVLLPAALIVLVAVCWRLGANPVLSFWLAYILTRPLGANIGDALGLPKSENGLGLGTFATSLIFLGAILATVLYLSISKADVIEAGTEEKIEEATPTARRPRRENAFLGVFALAAVAVALLLHHTSQQPHASALAEEEGGSSGPTVQLSTSEATKNFPPSDLATFKTIATDTLTTLQSGDQAGATARIKDLETAWDDDENKLRPLDATAWTFYDGEIDAVLTALRDPHPDVATETDALKTYIASLG